MLSAALRPPVRQDLDEVFGLVGEAAWESLRGQRVFMTGGTGFVGKWLLATLLHADARLQLGCRVTVLSRHPDAFRAEAPFLAEHPQVELVAGDVRDFDYPPGHFALMVHAATDVVANAAPLEVFDSCVRGTRRVLDFAVHCGAPRVLLVSSGAFYGKPPQDAAGVAEDYQGAPPIDDVRSAYGEGKRVTEWLGTAYRALHGLDIRVARCFAFVGPYLPLDKHFALGNFLRDAMRGHDIVIRGDGAAQRTYLYAADMAAWLWAIVLRGPANASYNVGGSEVVSIAELARRVTGVLGSEAPVIVQQQATAGMAPDRYVPDVRNVRSDLRLPAGCPLDEAIARTAAWHRGRESFDGSPMAASLLTSS